MIKKLIFLTGVLLSIYMMYGLFEAGTRNNGSPGSYTGSPADGKSCANGGCHSGSTTTVSGLITSDVPTAGYIPGNTYTITAKVGNPGGNKFGFEVSPQSSGGTGLGTLIAGAGMQLVNASKAITHTSSSTSQSDTATWVFSWVAPSIGTGNVTFYGCFNLANGDGGSGGDAFRLSTLILSENIPDLSVQLDSTNDLSCKASGDGEAYLSVLAGSGNYGYAWTSGSGTNSNTTLAGGSQNVTVTDNSSGMDTIISLLLAEPTEIILNTSSTDPLCGVANGTATVTPSGGTGGYSYLWASNAFDQIDSTATGLGVGTYSVSVTDVNGCVKSTTVSVTQSVVSISSVSAVNPLCASSSNGGITISISGGSTPYSFNWNSGQSTQNLTSIGIGTYTLTVTDQNSCTTDTTITLTAPDVQISGTVIHTSCGNSNGSISLNISGGSSPYDFNWASGSSISSLSNLASGNQTVTVSDLNGCSSDSTFSINGSSGISLSSTVTNTQCSNSTGEIGITVNGSNGTSSFQWDTNSGNQTTQTATGLAAGSYSVTVTDSLGCTASIGDAVSNQNGPVITITSTNVSCFSGNDGEISLSVSPASNYAFTWNTGATSDSIINLIAGNYFVTVTDTATGCFSVASHIISEPSQLTVSLNSTDPSCFGNDGVINSIVGGGVTPYNFLWNTGETSSGISGLGDGSYLLTVTDSNNCQTSSFDSLIIQPGPGIILSLNHVSCAGIADGNITIQVSSGTSPFTFDWNTGDSINSLSGLAGGTYIVTITDQVGCVKSDTFLITEPDTLQVFANLTDPDCYDFGGLIDLTVSGGVQPYSYFWNDSTILEDLSNAGDGMYFVTISDDNGCIQNNSYLLTAPPMINSSVSITDVLCNGDESGQIVLSLSAGTPPFNTTWNSGDSSATLSQLSGGMFIYSSIDGSGCMLSDTVLVAEPDPLVSIFNLVHDTALSCGGSAEANVSGGITPYSYSWESHSGLQTTQIATGMCPGYFGVNITDSNGCELEDHVSVLTWSVGISESPEKDISMFPNPSTGIVWIRNNDRELKNANIEVRNYLGEIVIKDQLESDFIDLTQQKKGVYFVRFESDVIFYKILIY